MKAENLNFKLTDSFSDIKTFIIENKDNFKNKNISEGLVLKGIGEKYLKIENNFYSWENLENNIIKYEDQQPIDELSSAILSWIFSEITLEKQYTPRKFKLYENFADVKNEILSHKAYYKTGLITGIGNDNIKVTAFNKKDYYIEWNEIENVVSSIVYDSIENLEEKRFTTSIIKQLFTDNYIEYSVEEKELMNEENSAIKLRYYRLFKFGQLSYKIIKEENEDISIRSSLVKSALKWNNGQLPLSINEEGVNHIILNKSTLVRADLKKNEHYTKVLKNELKLDLNVYTTEYSDEYIYHTHTYKNLIKFEKNCNRWIITYNNKNLLQNAFRKKIMKKWICDITTIKSTEICTINDYDNENNLFNPDLFIKIYNNFHRS